MPKNSPGRAWQSPKIENACGSLPSVSPLSYTFRKVGSIISGVTGQDFQSSRSVVTTPGIEAAVDVGLITGVIGAIGFGLRVGVCGGADAAGGNDATLGA